VEDEDWKLAMVVDLSSHFLYFYYSIDYKWVISAKSIKSAQVKEFPPENNFLKPARAWDLNFFEIFVQNLQFLGSSPHNLVSKFKDNNNSLC